MRGRLVATGCETYEEIRAWLQSEVPRKWSHSTLSQGRKLEIYAQCVVSSLLYGLSTAWLTTAARRRLDGFHARCLRRILRIPSAYISRVANTVVFAKAGQKSLSCQLLHRQLVLYGRLARRPDSCPVRAAVFKPNTVDPLELPGRRRRGRPRDTWAGKVRHHAVQLAGGEALLRDLLARTPEAISSWAGLLSRLQ